MALRGSIDSIVVREVGVTVVVPTRSAPAAEPAAWSRGGRTFVVLGIEDDRAAKAFALAFSSEVLLVAKCQMQDAAFA